MWINVRTFCGNKTEKLDGLSKLTTVQSLRLKIRDIFNVEPDHQKLFYRGKLLVDQHTLFDYNVAINDTIQLMIKAVASSEAVTENNSPTKSKEKLVECSGLFTVGEEVDVFDPGSGAWFEGVVRKCMKRVGSDELVYVIKLDEYEECDNMTVRSHEIRPRAHYIFPVSELSAGLQCMVNYNLDQPSDRGFWYDATIISVSRKRGASHVVAAKVMIGFVPTDVELTFVDEIFRIESRDSKELHDTSKDSVVISNVAKRVSAPQCTHCQDNVKKKCKFCACSVCGDKANPAQILLCDECDYAFHLYCLDPPLSAVPEEDDWYCSRCKNDATEIVQAGEALKSKKTSRGTVNNARDWGKGMACQGRTKICTLVPQDHVGPVPGIPVGSMWKYRLQVSEVGVHRPHVAGIHGRENDGAYSIVLSGGYEDDKDDGEEFYYTGSGGRDLSGNKRTAEQSSDQKLTKMNLALARCCAAKLDVKQGADSGTEWKKGRQIRVVRNCKLAKHSKYAPKEGNRYDGIYKLVRYWPEKGQSGFLVWRYLLRRDDSAPAPWTEKGKAMSKKLGLRIVYPEGYSENKENSPATNGKKRKRDSNVTLEDIGISKKSNNEIDEKLRSQIALDVQNKRQWDALMSDLASWHDKVSEHFSCIICCDLVLDPVTTPCGHNMCQKCLKRSFAAEVFTCPNCRFELGKKFELNINSNLKTVLLTIFPGYDSGR